MSQRLCFCSRCRSVKDENVFHQEIDNLLFPTGRGAYYGGCTSVLLLHVANESYLKRSEKTRSAIKNFLMTINERLCYFCVFYANDRTKSTEKNIRVFNKSVISHATTCRVYDSNKI